MYMFRALLIMVVLMGGTCAVLAQHQKDQERIAKHEEERAKYRAYEMCKYYFTDHVAIQKYGLDVGREANAHCADRLK